MKKIIFIVFLALVLVLIGFFLKKLFLNPSSAKTQFQLKTITLTSNVSKSSILNSLDKNFNSCFVKESVKAQSIKVFKLDSLIDLYNYQPDFIWPIASLTKLMTALISLENLKISDEFVFSQEAVKIEGNRGNFSKGEKYRLLDLVKAIIVSSSNDAAYLLANNEKINQKNFVLLMNKKAKELKMKDTIFYDPTGLSLANQSTANDLKKLVSYLFKNYRLIFDISLQEEIAILELNHFKEKILKNINPLVKTKNFLGGKTGFLKAAKKNLIALFFHQKGVISIIILGADNPFDIYQKIVNCLK